MIINGINQLVYSFDTTAKKMESRSEANKKIETFCLINKFDPHPCRYRGAVASVMEWIT